MSGTSGQVGDLVFQGQDQQILALMKPRSVRYSETVSLATYKTI